MSWQVSGRSMEICSCKQFCPCWLGPAGKPDQGWCASAFAFDVQHGNSEGVELGGTKVVLMADWPGNFFHGEGTARLYIDESANEEQRRQLTGIFSGRKGGHLEALWDAVIREWLPTQVARVELGWNETPSLRLDGVGQATLEPSTNGSGQPTKISGTMGQAGLQVEVMQLASVTDSDLSDPELRHWQAEDGVLFDFNWNG